jgi:hypothetical protein
MGFGGSLFGYDTLIDGLSAATGGYTPPWSIGLNGNATFRSEYLQPSTDGTVEQITSAEGAVFAKFVSSATTGQSLSEFLDMQIMSGGFITGARSAFFNISDTGQAGLTYINIKPPTDGDVLDIQRANGNFLLTCRTDTPNCALLNGAPLGFYSDNYSTETLSLNGSNGAILSQSTGGIGYGSGAGGVVTQATSRTTGVTLNKTAGAITLVAAAGSTTPATFTVTNSTVAATDTIHLSQKSGSNLYVLLVTAVAAGSFNVTVYTTGGTVSEAPVINFAVIKGATS